MPPTKGCALPETSPRLQATAVLDEDVSRVKFVSGAREEALRRLGIRTVGDLLRHIPHRYLDFMRAFSIEDAPLGEVCTVTATIDRVSSRRTRSHMSLVEVTLVDDTGALRAVFFKQPWVARDLQSGDRVAVMGKVEFSHGFKEMASPHYEKLDRAAAGIILPVHPVGEGLSTAWMRRIVSSALEAASGVLDPVPSELRARRRLMSLAAALRAIHFPRSFGERDLARRRLAFDELLLLQLALRLRNDANLVDVVPVAHVVGGPCAEALSRALPFTLSDEQQACVEQILSDMADGGRVMNRLLLGDVGTGKTAVACFALAAAADTGTQAAVMAPTGVLARQYAVKAGPLLDAAGISWTLITGSTPPAERERATRELAAGGITVAFGTQALLSDDVRFDRLSIVVIDEQHRFGVGQRNALRAKGPGADLLVMTATPIPRTLALSVYGDLDRSIIRNRPVKGAGVTTRVLTEGSRDIAAGALRDAVAAGRQAYVICPLVEAGDSPADFDGAWDGEGEGAAAGGLRDVATEAERVGRLLPGARVGVLHGRMRAADKDRVTDEFRSGDLDVLISTTVVEVGVDVPNATVMVIENGERFGLATLHQLRGRVGRGSEPGCCFVMTRTGSSGRATAARRRLEALERTEDGFALSEMDLRLRHEGEILGFRQSGGVSLRYVDLDQDVDVIEAAHEEARDLLRRSRDLGAAGLLPLRHEVVARYGNVFKEVSGG